jgi:hypothetical protein
VWRLNKQLGLLLLIPMLSMLALPVFATSSTTVTHTYPYPGVTLYVHCYTDGSGSPASGASITFQGHTVIVLCPSGTGEPGKYSVDLCLPISATSKFTATTFAGGFHNKQTGTFGPGYGEVFGEQESSGDSYSSADYILYSPCFPNL